MNLMKNLSTTFDTFYDLESMLSKLSKMNELFVSIWTHKFNKWKEDLTKNTSNKWKIKNRSQKQCKTRMEQILRGDLINGEISPSFGIYQIIEIDENTLKSFWNRSMHKRQTMYSKSYWWRLFPYWCTGYNFQLHRLYWIFYEYKSFSI